MHDQLKRSIAQVATRYLAEGEDWKTLPDNSIELTPGGAMKFVKAAIDMTPAGKNRTSAQQAEDDFYSFTPTDADAPPIGDGYDN